MWFTELHAQTLFKGSRPCTKLLDDTFWLNIAAQGHVGNIVKAYRTVSEAETRTVRGLTRMLGDHQGVGPSPNRSTGALP